jgi:hypothetical protein
MANSNNTSAWGWIVLIALIALLGVGFLYQREGGKLFGPWSEDGKQSPQQTVARPTEPASRPAPSALADLKGANPPKDQSPTTVEPKPIAAQEVTGWLAVGRKRGMVFHQW